MNLAAVAVIYTLYHKKTLSPKKFIETSIYA